MIQIRSLRLMPGEESAVLRIRAAKKLGVPPGAITEIALTKKSLDARKKNDIHYICAVAVKVRGNEAEIIKKAASPDVGEYKDIDYSVPAVCSPHRPVVVGFGPGGMFAALVLSRAGLRPIVIERGQEALKRKAAVDSFRAGGELQPESNVQFGEGGAGTFSDGKLNTGTHDRRMRWMLREFYRHGAPESVTYDAKPHIGTDVLIDVVQSIRREIIALGGEVRFETRMDGFRTDGDGICAVCVTHKGVTEDIPCRDVILAIGHSARDTYEMLCRSGLGMERKPFSMGVRIEHRQSDIDLAQYGKPRGKLPPADYSLNVHLPDGESAYTFCMCPGGEVFAAASETGGVCTNGMSYSRRDGENANAALLVTLHPEDYPGEGVLAGMYWQREIERRAYEYSGSYNATSQLVGDFLAERASTGQGSVTPSYLPGVFWGDIRRVLPDRITSVLAKAIPELGKKLEGFDREDAVLTAPETRSSSPVRILRDDSFQSSVPGLYPCGEGAGYAGGISSAAIDGMRCAEKVIERQGEYICQKVK